LFDKLKKTLSKAVKEIKQAVTQKEIKESDLNEILEELMFDLVEADVAYEVAEEIVETIKASLIGKKIPRGKNVSNIVKETLKTKLLEILDKPTPNLIEEAKQKKPGERPLVIVFLGVNGVGKTTTIAKIAYKMKKSGVIPVLAAADTFRAGAQEQLAKHAKKIDVPIIIGKYGSDPAAVAHDAISYATARGYRVVLIDTAGRMHVDYDLMGELRKIVKVSRPDYKVLVLDSLTGNDAVEQARKFNEEVGVDIIILTKVDADVKGGTAISAAATTGKPIAYIGVGQTYDDLEEFNAKKFVEELLG